MAQLSALLKSDFTKRTIHSCPVETHTNGDNDDVALKDESVQFIKHSNSLAYLHVLADNIQRSFSKFARAYKNRIPVVHGSDAVK